MSAKRPSDAPPDVAAATPAKRTKTDDTGVPSGSAVTPAGGEGSVSSSPAVGKDTDSPSSRGRRGGGPGRGGGGGRGGDRGSRGGRGGRGGGRGGKRGDDRSWGGRSSNARDGKMREWGKKEDSTAEGAAESPEKKDRLPKKKVAVLFGYNGMGYNGSQMNPNAETIEGEVWKACIKAGAVSEDNSNDPTKVGLSRAARTDAGVSAVVNVIALKLILSPPDKPSTTTIEDWINSFLPPVVRIWSCLRVQGSFNPRTLCDQRHYEYTLPTHVFLGPKPGTSMHTWLAKSRAAVKATATPAAPTPASEAPVVEGPETVDGPTATLPAMADSEAFWAAQPEGTTFAQDLIAKRQWRISPGLLKAAREFVQAYEGSHNYYNFTVAKDFRDRTCQRTMRKLEITDPFLVNGVEYVSITVLGQSFMLHQIRKMVGLLILATRSASPSSLVPETFGPSRIHIPKAPALGLALLEPQYVEYNKRVDESNRRLIELKEAGRMPEEEAVSQTRDPVTIEAVKEPTDTFKQEHVYTKMWEVERDQAIFSNWLNYLDCYVGPDFEYLNPKGIIPPTAVFKKDENPEKIRVSKDAIPTTTEGDEKDLVAQLFADEGGQGEEEG